MGMSRIHRRTTNMKIAALSLLVALAVVGTNAHAGLDKCTWGPAYWCRSIKEAKECNAVNHCINHNWAQLAIKKETTDACELCEMVIQEVKAIITPDFEKQVEDAWAQVCAIIPIATIKQECETIGTEIPLVFEMIKSALQPQQVCTAIGLCTSENIFASFLPRLGDDCQDCSSFLGDIKRRCVEKGQAQVEEDIKGMCSIAGPYKGMCEQLIGQYMDKIYDALTTLDAGKVCKFAGMC